MSMNLFEAKRLAAPKPDEEKRQPVFRRIPLLSAGIDHVQDFRLINPKPIAI
jgi:hypothetical protein